MYINSAPCRQVPVYPSPCVLPTEHYVVLGLSMHVSLLQCAREELHVATAAVNVLLVLHGKLDDQCFTLVGERVEAGRLGIEVGILAGLQT